MNSISAAPSESFGSTPLDLLRAAKQGDVQAFDALIERFGPYMLAILRNRGLDADATREVFHNMLLALLRNLSTFNRKRDGSFRKYLAQTAVTKSADHQRAEQKWRDAPGGLAFDWEGVADPRNEARNQLDAETMALLALVHRELENVLPFFSEVHQEAFRRVYLNGEAPHFVRKELGIRSDSMYHAFKRILNRLRSRLGERPPRGGAADAEPSS